MFVLESEHGVSVSGELKWELSQTRIDLCFSVFLWEDIRGLLVKRNRWRFRIDVRGIFIV